MAVLDNSSFTEIRQYIKSDPTIRGVFKAWGLSKQTWQDAFQAAEDWFVSAFTTTPTTSFKAAIEVETGASTNAQAKAVARTWMNWRFSRDI
jgi:hypothetical protein